ncbi:MAG: hypothetical protein ACC742_05620 [Thermoanaerobaculales bacterium]
MKKPTTLIAFALGISAILVTEPAAAQTGPAEGDFVGPPVSLCPTVVVSGVENPDDMNRGRFSATHSADLVFHVLFDRSLEKEHVVTLKIFTPHGYMYRRLDVPLAPEKGEATPGVRRLPGYPYPIQVQALHPAMVDGTTYESVDVSFPVAGSTIVTSSLYGRWKVEVSLDGFDRPCGQPVFFELVQ